MAVLSVRFNDKETRIPRIFKKYHNCNYLNLLKLSFFDLYEEIKDKEIIEEFEEKEKSSKVSYLKIEDIISENQE